MSVLLMMRMVTVGVVMTTWASALSMETMYFSVASSLKRVIPEPKP